MQMKSLKAEREAFRLLPGIIAELFDEPAEALRVEATSGHDDGVDLVAEGHGRRWLMQVKAGSSPGLVAAAADQLPARAGEEGLPVLVVPFMTKAGAKAADALDLNWVDLSGNAQIRDPWLYISVHGRPNRFRTRGRPSSPFAPKSSRVARTMLLDPDRWWRQRDLAAAASLDDGQVSRIVRRLKEEELLASMGAEVRPLDPGRLLDAWSGEYRFDRHEMVWGHASGSGIELARELNRRLLGTARRYAFTGLAAAWLHEPFARFRLNSLYVEGDPHEAAEQLGLRLDERGANVQVIAPDDEGVFAGKETIETLPCVSRPQIYLDLGQLPERAREAADKLREEGLWHASSR
jgi:Transcriptional regulator, AbiEi antitoxin, Type IV TA system